MIMHSELGGMVVTTSIYIYHPRTELVKCSHHLRHGRNGCIGLLPSQLSCITITGQCTADTDQRLWHDIQKR